MNGTAIREKINALGIIETYTAASCVLAADAAAKAGDVHLVELRLSAGLGGKAFVLMTGEVSAVQSSVDAGAAQRDGRRPGGQQDCDPLAQRRSQKAVALEVDEL